jgi:hypothetical protein
MNLREADEVSMGPLVDSRPAADPRHVFFFDPNGYQTGRPPVCGSVIVKIIAPARPLAQKPTCHLKPLNYRKSGG